MSWMDKLPPDEDPRKKRWAIALIVFALLSTLWNLSPRGRRDDDVVPPPSSDVYRGAVEEIASARYDGSVLEIAVDRRWHALQRPEQHDRIATLLELTGSFEYTRIRISDTSGQLVASVDATGGVTWMDGPPP